MQIIVEVNLESMLLYRLWSGLNDESPSYDLQR